MAYTNFTNCTKEQYETEIYGQDYRHKIKIIFNDTELENADRYCEKFTVKPRIIPNGGETFSLNNFIAKEAELILHDVDSSVIQDQISISIGTYIKSVEKYEYVPIGIFNIQDKPTTDKNKITIKLRDNAVKFDFGYDAKPLMDENEGKATYKQIFNDICTKAGVETDITTFSGEDKVVGVYDNTITARTYMADIAEQAGRIPTIDRNGKLIFVDILNLTTWNIPLSIVEKYEIGTSYKIGKVVYESGIVKYQTEDSTDDTLYIDSSNQYVDESTVNTVLELTNGFEIDSMKTGKILGNPAIDGFDLISITDGDKTYKTLATHDLTYTGTMIQTFDTTISEKLKEENVTLNSDATFQKWARTTIDNVNAEVKITTGKVTTVENTVNNNYNEIIGKFGDYAPKSDLITIEESVTQLQTNTYTKTEINEIISGTSPDGTVVSSVKTTAGILDKDGLTIEQSAADTKTNINANGMIIYDATGGIEDALLTVNKDGVIAKNIRVDTYLNIGQHSRIEDYTSPDHIEGTGVFWIGGE